MPIGDDNQQSPSEALPPLPGFDSQAAPAAPSLRPRPLVIEAEPINEATGAQVSITDSTTVRPPEDPYLGRTYGGYCLETRIGQGGMGTVYKGRQVSLDRVVAVKILNKALYENAEFIKRFEREAKSIARINHANIVAVYDFGQHDGLWYMVNEFIEGSSLARLIGERMVVPLAECSLLMIDCLAGLAHVGRMDIVHRDIKPDNILLTRDNIAKIADFGLAKNVSNQEEHTDLTAVGLAMGTPAYMSPEQCMGRKLDHRSDQYAMGVTAYFALTGAKPFTGQSSFEIMTRQRELVPPLPHVLNPSLPAACSDVVMRMLAKDPADRFLDSEQCRLAWIELAASLGVGPGAVMRSGEIDVGARPRSNRYKTPVDALPVIQPQVLATPSPSPPTEPPVRPAESVPGPRASGEYRMPTAPGDPSNRSGRLTPAVSADGGEGKAPSERMLRNQASEAITCPRCGHLNRAGSKACGRCGTVLAGTGTAISPRAQEAQADRLFSRGRHKEAAGIYAQLADQEQDRRQKSVLRAKEREARRADQERQIGDLQNRSNLLAERGDITGAIELLEQARGLGDPTSSAGAAADRTLDGAIAVLRSRLNRQHGRRWALVGLAVALVILAALIGWFALRSPAAQPVTPTPRAAS
jgi:serine/threonine protein kinase